MEFEGEKQASLPPGFVFDPSDDLLVSYFLSNKIDGQPLLLPRDFTIPELNLYDHAPWELFRTASRPRYLPADTFFCFVRLKRSAARDHRLKRKSRGGTWVVNGTCNVLRNGRAAAGTRAALKFFKDGDEGKSRRDRSLGTDWIMHEYRLHPSLYEKVAACAAEEIILCRVHRKRSRKTTNTGGSGADDEGESHPTVAPVAVPSTSAPTSTGYLNDVVSTAMTPPEPQEGLSSVEFADNEIAAAPLPMWMQMEALASDSESSPLYAGIDCIPSVRRLELETACEQFSNIIASLPNCTLYKGTLSSGVEIAVTSTTVTLAEDWSEQYEAHFRNKISTLCNLNQKNFMNLLGYCMEEEPFTQRARVAMGIAYCLLQMEQLNPPLVPNNLSSSSIYLTDDYGAKISNLEFWSEEKEENLTSENSQLENIVYKFGIILVEIISGRLPYSEDDGLLVLWTSRYLNGRRPLTDMVDRTLDSIHEEEISQLADVIRSCIDASPERLLIC